MKIKKKKGRVFPSLSSSSSAAAAALKLLPTAIFSLVALLSIEDREVLAYLITRSVKTAADFTENPIKKSSKKSDFFVAGVCAGAGHRSPVFDCDCFECYTSYWFRWDSSPNRELIHQAIEAFEDRLATGEKSVKNGRGKKRARMGRPNGENAIVMSPENEVSPEKETQMVEMSQTFTPVVEVETGGPVPEPEPEPEPENTHKGLAGKVLPDLLGIFNWRLWGLWCPYAY